MAEKDGKDDVARDFDEKASTLASSKTLNEREKAAKKVIKSADRLAEEAEENGLTDELLAQILEDIDDEREQERLTKEKSGG